MIDYIKGDPKLIGNDAQGVVRVQEKIQSLRAKPAADNLEHMLRVLISLVLCPVSSIDGLIRRIDESQDEASFLPNILPQITAKFGQKSIIHPSHVSKDDHDIVKQLFGIEDKQVYLDSMVHYSQAFFSIDKRIDKQEKKEHPILRKFKATRTKFADKATFLNKSEIHAIIRDIAANKDKCFSGKQFEPILSVDQIIKYQQIKVLFTVPPDVLFAKSAIIAMLFVKVALHFEVLPKDIRRNSPALLNLAPEIDQALRSGNREEISSLNRELRIACEAAAGDHMSPLKRDYEGATCATP